MSDNDENREQATEVVGEQALQGEMWAYCLLPAAVEVAVVAVVVIGDNRDGASACVEESSTHLCRPVFRRRSFQNWMP